MRRRTPTPSLRATLQGGTARSGTTRPHGVKVMAKGEDTIWTDAEGTEHSVRELPSLTDQLAQQLAEGLATASRANTVSTSSPDDIGTDHAAADQGYPEGAFWTQVELVDGDVVEVDRWTVRDGTWVRVGLDAGRLVTGSIDAGLIDVVALAAKLVTSGLIRTAAAGQRVELTSEGLVLWLLDGDGQEYEGVRIGPTGATLVTVGDVTIAPRSVTAPAVNAGTLTVGGLDAAAFVDGRIQARSPQLVAIGGAGNAGGNITADPNMETGLFDVLVPQIFHDAWYRVDVLFISYPTGLEVETRLALRVSRGDQGVMTNSPRIDDRPVGAVRADIWDSKQTTFWFRGAQLATNPGVTDGGSARLLLTMTGASRKLIAATSTTMAVYLEATPAIGFSSTINRGGAPLPGSTTATPQQPVTQTQSYTRTWAATGSTTYYDSSNQVYSGSPDVIQGSYDGSAGARRHGVWWFPDMTGDLAGATITSVEIWVDNIHTYAAGGGTGHFWTHDGRNAAGANWMNATFARGQDRWLPIPSQHWGGLKNGSIRGFMALTTSNALAEYARFAGGAGSAQIRISYSK